MDGFTYGFRLGYNGPRIGGGGSKNLKSVLQFPEKTKEKIDSEIELGRIAGPFANKPIENLKVSPIGIIPKTEGRWRLITHLSYPEGNSVNDFIDPNQCSVAYTSLDEVFQKIAELGTGNNLAKMDIKSAFRLLIIHPGDFKLLGFQFLGSYYIDKCLPMGCAVSCDLFEKFSTFLNWALQQNTGIESVFHYLDDFLFIGKMGTDECITLMKGFEKLCDFIGVPLAPEKNGRPNYNSYISGNGNRYNTNGGKNTTR